jgi:hypothetical protein
MPNEITPGQHLTAPAPPSEDGRPLGQAPTAAPRQFSKKQLALAFAIAAIADAIGVFTALSPPISLVVDVVTANYAAHLEPLRQPLGLAAVART